MAKKKITNGYPLLIVLLLISISVIYTVYVNNQTSKTEEIETRIDLSNELLSQAEMFASSETIDEKTKSEILKNVEEAINQAKIATERYPDSIEAWNNLGLIYYKLSDEVEGSTDLSVKAYEKTLTIDPNNSAALMSLGNIYFDLDNFEKALENYSKVMRNNPEYVDVYIKLGETYQALGDNEKALDAFSKASNLVARGTVLDKLINQHIESLQ